MYPGSRGNEGEVGMFYRRIVSVLVCACWLAMSASAAAATGGTGAIAGTVTNNAATPVALAHICVSASPSAGGVGGGAQTDSSGHYTISGLPTGAYRVQFSDCTGGGYITQYYNGQSSYANATLVQVTAPNTTSLLPAKMVLGAKITGLVTNNAATPVALARICVSASPSTGGGGGSAQTDSSGHYTISGLPTGSYKVQFSDCGGAGYITQYYNGQSSYANATLVQVTAPNTTSLLTAKMVLGGKITGLVTNNAATPVALANICVSASPSTGGAFGGSAQTDSSGHYIISALPTGSYKVQFSDCMGRGYITQYYNGQSSYPNAALVQVTAPNTTSLLPAKMVLGGKITGLVTNNAATPVALPRICVSATQSAAGVGGSAQTDSSGHYTISGLPTGAYKVQFSDCGGAGYISQYYNGQSSYANATLVQVTAPNTTTLLTAKMVLGGKITGLVTNNAATPVALANICVSVSQSAGGFGGGAQTDSSGHYTISGLPTGAYKVAFSDCTGAGYIGQYYNGQSSYANATLVQVTAPNATSLLPARMVLGGKITGLVTNNAATPVALARICVSASPSTGGGVGGSAQTDSSGHYTISGLPTGAYKVGFSDCTGGGYISQYYNGQSSYANATLVQVTAPNTTSAVNAKMVLGGKITGLVTNNAATPVALARICVSASPSTGGGVGGSAQTDSSGHYTISGLPTGSYKVQFSDCGGAGYITQYYNGQSSYANATPVQVTAPNTTSAVNAKMVHS